MGDILIDSMVDSGHNPIVLRPEYTFAEEETALRNSHRTLGHVRRSYDWGSYRKYSVPLRYVNSADMSRMNGWWRENHEVAFTRNDSETSTTLCQIVNQQKPFGLLMRPYDDLYRGALMLEQARPHELAEQPFVLDVDTWSALDKTYNALL